MSNQSYSTSNKLLQNLRPRYSTVNYDRCKLPVISSGTANMSNMNESYNRSSSTHFCAPQTNEDKPTKSSNFYNSSCNISMPDNFSSQMNPTSSGSANHNACTSSYNNCKTNCSYRGNTLLQTISSPPKNTGMCNNMPQNLSNKDSSSNQLNGFEKTNIINTVRNKNLIVEENKNCQPRPMTFDPTKFYSPSLNMNTSKEQKTIVRDCRLANEILKKAGIPSNSTPNDCLEVVTDVPVTVNDNVNCDPEPLCMKKPVDYQECYEQSIVVRHLQPPRATSPPPIIIRERCTSQLSPKPPIVIRQIPARPTTPPPLIIRECPPIMPDIQAPTIIEREVPPSSPPPRQVIVERLPTPPPKPRQIILEKWLPYEEPKDRPCIVEKITKNEMVPPKNLIIQYESVEPKVQPQCIDEGISYVDPKQYINDKSNENAEICYVDHLNNLPDHIKCQLSAQTLAAIGIQSGDKQNTNCNPYTARTNRSCFNQQNSRPICSSIRPMPPRRSTMTNGCHSTKPWYSQQYNSTSCRQQTIYNRGLSASTASLSQYANKYNTNVLVRPSNQGSTNLIRAHYNPWATTYQVSYTNKSRGMCRTR